MSHSTRTDAGPGYVSLYAEDNETWASVTLFPDEARLLGLRLIKLADRAEDEE